MKALDAFIRKYYKNLLIRGIILSCGIVVTLFLAIVLTEYFGWLAPVWRGVMLWGSVAAVCGVVGWFVARPLLKMYGLSRNRLTREEAAQIVGRHFPEVSDKLLNLLQLMGAHGQQDMSDATLLQAAVQQKTAQLSPVPMLKAVDLKKNRRYLKYALPPLAVLLLLLIFVPKSIVNPSKRLVNYTTVYERPQPFRFVVPEGGLKVVQGSDYELTVTTEGEAVPAEVYVRVDGIAHKMQSDGGRFGYTFRQVRRSVVFVLEGGGVVSAPYMLEVLPNPAVLSFRVLLSYPAYTGREDEVLVDQGDMTVPEGTVARWVFQTQDADSIYFAVGDGTAANVYATDANGRAEVRRTVRETMEYAFSVSCGSGDENSSELTSSDTLKYAVVAVADAMPQISVDEMVDSLNYDKRVFIGSISDDYGFSRLVFKHKVDNGAALQENGVEEAEIALKEGAVSQEFYFTFNIAAVSLNPGDALTYWFEVSDNDGIHGPKTTRSRQFEVKIPSYEGLDSMIAQGSEAARRNAESQMDELRKLQEEINEMIERLVGKKEMTWQDKKDLESIRERQKEVREAMQQMQQQIRDNNRLEQRYFEQSEQLMEKQRELDRLMNEVMDEKMRETMAEIDRMMQELDKNKVQQNLEQLKVDNAELEKQIDQNIELMKWLDMEKRVEKAVNEAERLSKEQKDLGEETKSASRRDADDLQERQRKVHEGFEHLKEDIYQIREDYKELDSKNDFKVPDELLRQIEHAMNGAEKGLQKGNNKEASQQQQQSADGLEQLSEALAEAQLDMEQENTAEDADQIRQLLKNLVQLSFDQEGLIKEVGDMYIQDPQYQDIIARQNRIRDDFVGVRDSLYSLAKRQVQVASVVNREVGAVASNLQQSLGALLNMNQGFYGNYKNTGASRSMQYSMTSLNNLALILAESLDQMQDQMRQNAQKKKNGQCKNKGKSNQQCNNPGRNPSPKSMRQMQQELNRQMEALKKQLDKQGSQQNGRHKVGEQQGMSEELARMAAQQEMIRRMMQEYAQSMKESDAGNGQMAREMDQMLRQMEQTETDLVNRTITQQTIQRQQQIMTRMLQHEKAEMEREKEERRESHEANEMYGYPSAEELLRYNKKQEQQDDQLRYLPPTLQPFYRTLANDYFYRQR